MLFSTMKLLFSIILIVVILIISFIVGLVMLIRGFIRNRLAKYAGMKPPKALMLTGIVLVSIPLAAIVGLSLWSITSSVNTIYTRSHYQSIPDIWRNESVSHSRAEDDIIYALLKSADNGNREAFVKNFTPEVQKNKGFDKAVDQFFESYPVGLSECEKYDMTRSDPASYDTESTAKIDSVSFRCELGETWYFIIIEYCYFNPDEPDKVGVTKCRVMNLEAAAVYYENEAANPADAYPVCDIKSSSEYNARLVGGRAYLWTPTDTPRISQDELRRLLEKAERLDDPLLKYAIGEPNLIIKNDDSTEYGYFFELSEHNGTPCYAYFQTDSERGHILWALLCTPYEVDYDHPLVEYKANQ